MQRDNSCHESGNTNDVSPKFHLLIHLEGVTNTEGVTNSLTALINEARRALTGGFQEARIDLEIHGNCVGRHPPFLANFQLTILLRKYMQCYQC